MADEGEYMLSTSDNPFNPWTQYDEWNMWDTGTGGYHTNQLLARVTITSDALSEPDQDRAINDAINEIVTRNVSGVHIKVAQPAALPTTNN